MTRDRLKELHLVHTHLIKKSTRNAFTGAIVKDSTKADTLPIHEC